MAGQKTILIIDDDTAFIKLMKKHLEAKAYDVLTASNGEDGLKMIGKYALDLIVLDIVLPKIGGIELYKKVAEIEKQGRPKVPIMIVTSRKELEELFNDLGVDGFITKPIDIQMFMQEVDRIVEKKTSGVVYIIDSPSQSYVNDIKAVVNKQGFKAIFIDTLETFTAMAQKTRPNFILMEYKQKAMPGLEFIKKLKEIPATFSTDIWPPTYRAPIIVYTYSDENFKIDALSSGADIYIGKPKDTGAFITALKQAAEKIKDEKELEELQKQGGKSNISLGDIKGVFGS